MKNFTFKNDDELSKIIWPQFVSNIDSKHGISGAIGREGEEAALNFFANNVLFPDLKYTIRHDDFLHQMNGIDYTLIHKNQSVKFVDVKTGSEYLDWDPKKSWKIYTPKVLKFDSDKKKTDDFIFIGKKYDVFVMFNISKMKNYITENKLKGQSLKIKDWPNFVYTNLKS